jgi:hypothetical protein
MSRLSEASIGVPRQDRGMPDTADEARSRNDPRHCGRRGCAVNSVPGKQHPEALYGDFRVAFGYSALTQALLYAGPLIAIILPGRLVFGPVSDAFGRRPLIAGGVISFAIGDMLFALATRLLLSRP